MPAFLTGIPSSRLPQIRINDAASGASFSAGDSLIMPSTPRKFYNSTYPQARITSLNRCPILTMFELIFRSRTHSYAVIDFSGKCTLLSKEKIGKGGARLELIPPPNLILNISVTTPIHPNKQNNRQRHDLSCFCCCCCCFCIS